MEYRFPIQVKDSFYFATASKIDGAHLYACGLPIGEYREDAAAVPATVKETVAAVLPGGRVIDMLHGDPLHAGLSPLATFVLVIIAETTPSLTFIPVEMRPKLAANGEFRAEIGGRTLIYKRDWCGFE